MNKDAVLIVGLGNPGNTYKNTRHNIGFKCIETLQKECLLAASEWKTDKKFKADISIGNYMKTKVIMIKPLTFMNLSGFSVSLMAGYYKIKTDNIIVIYDDKDLDIGSFRIRDMGSSGGHNGIKSIAQNLGTQSFARFKLGIANDLLNHMETADFVLSNFKSKEQKIINDLIKDRVIPSLFEVITSDTKTAQNKFGS